MEIGSYLFSTTLQVVGALAFFIYGMKVMSDGIQRAAGDKLRDFLRLMTVNRYTGAVSGFFITALLQSSSATTVMTVSFVSAGLLTLVESAGIMMGANIGTTITGWVVSIVGFKVKISLYALPIFGIGFVMNMFGKSARWKDWGLFFIGFSLLFMGLAELKQSVPDINDNPVFLKFLTDLDFPVILNTVFYVLVGALVTIIVQSSSAAMSLTIILVSQGLPLEIGCAMILGENIGTTITAELASLVGSVNARRSAKVHTLFNLFGVSWMIFLLPFIVSPVYRLAQFFGGGEELSLAVFHTIFNLCNVLLLIWFVPFLVRLATKLVRSKEEDDEGFKLIFIGRNAINYTVDAYILQARKEVEQFLTFSSVLLKRLSRLLEEDSAKKRNKILSKIVSIEENTDKLEEEITIYLSKVQQRSLSLKQVEDVEKTLQAVKHFEKFADMVAELASFSLEKKGKSSFMSLKPLQIGVFQILETIEGLFHLLEGSFQSCFLKQGETSFDTLKIKKELRQMESSVSLKIQDLTKIYIKEMDKGVLKVKAAIHCKDTLDDLERLAAQIGKLVFLCCEVKS